MTISADGSTRGRSDGATRLKVFISYSRRDLDFVDRLQSALEDAGVEASVDREDIEKGEAWWARIQQLITEADTVVFVLSPDSIASPVCQQEVDFAESLNKRFVPVVARDIAGLAAPAALARLNYIFFIPKDGASGDFGTTIGELTRALQTNIQWIREHTRLGTLAQRWEDRKRPQDLLMRGNELAAAETWLTSRPPGAPDPTDAHRALITESRRSMTRRQRRTLALSLSAVAVSLSLALVAYLKQVEAQQTLATSDFINGTRLFLDPATAHEGLGLLSRASGLENRDRAIIRLNSAAQQDPFWVKAPAPAPAPAAKTPPLPPQYSNFGWGKTISHSISDDGQRIAVSVSNGESHPEIRVAVFENGRAITNWFVPKAEEEQWLYTVRVALSPDGRLLATERQDWRSASYVQVYDLTANKLIGVPVRATGLVSAFQQRGFKVTKFLSNRLFGHSDDEHRHLLVGSERGDAAIYFIDETNSQLLLRHQHGDAVVAAAVGGKPGAEILVSFDAAFTGKVSGIHGNNTRHPDIQAEFAPQRIIIATDGSSISLFGANGQTAQFRLIAPSPRNPALGTSADGDTATGVSTLTKPYCQLPTQKDLPTEKETTARATKQFAARGRVLNLEDRRLTIRDLKGAPIATRDFPWPIVAVCTTEHSDALAIGLDNLDVEVWRPDLSEQIGVRIKQATYLNGAQRPDQFISAQLSDDATKVLTVTHFWNPPNLGFYWISLYDLATGLPLIRSLNFVDEETDYGILTDDGSRIVLGAGHFKTTFKPIRQMRLLPAAEAKSGLVDSMARIAERMPPSQAAD